MIDFYDFFDCSDYTIKMIKEILDLHTLFLAGSFIIWALIHTGTALLKVKDYVLENCSAFWHRWYRLIYIIVASVTFLPVLYFFWISPGSVIYRLNGTVFWLLRSLQILALLGVVWSTLQTNFLDFSGFTENSRLKKNTSPVPMIVKGPFRWIRHPMYSFNMVLIWCQPVMTSRLFILFLLMTLYFFLGSLHEERLLSVEFGDDYRKYKNRTGRFLPFKTFVKSFNKTD